MGHGENNTDERGDDSKLEQRLKYLFPTQYDVGVDYNGFAPVSFGQVKRIINKQTEQAKVKSNEDTIHE